MRLSSVSETMQVMYDPMSVMCLSLPRQPSQYHDARETERAGPDIPSRTLHYLEKHVSVMTREGRESVGPDEGIKYSSLPRQPYQRYDTRET